MIRSADDANSGQERGSGGDRPRYAESGTSSSSALEEDRRERRRGGRGSSGKRGRERGGSGEKSDKETCREPDLSIKIYRRERRAGSEMGSRFKARVVVDVDDFPLAVVKSTSPSN